jgi:hypothetical protein
MNPQIPPITEDIRRRAEQAPGSWIYSVDPGYRPDEAVPGHAIRGAWPVDEQGQLGDFVVNAEYRPSPAGMGLTEPSDAIDAAMQQAATGHGPDDAVTAALAAGPVYLPMDADGEPIAYAGTDGATVAVFTHPGKAPADVPQMLNISLAALLDQLPPGTPVVVNPGSEVSLTMTCDELSAALSGG